MATFIPGSAATATTEVELSISAQWVIFFLLYFSSLAATNSLLSILKHYRNLVGSDVFSKSDPMCVVYTQPLGSSRWTEYRRTETITDDHNPNFATKVIIPYRFEEQQPLKFEIYDVDSNRSNLSDHDFLGSAICSLGQIISGGKVKLTLLFSKRSTICGITFYTRIQ